MKFDFATANRIIFGAGSITEIPALVSTLGNSVFLVTDSPERSSPLRKNLLMANVNIGLLIINNEPDYKFVELATRIYKESKAELVIGLGGGSAIDTGKAIAALANNPGDIRDYLEVIGAGRPFDQPSLPYIAIPTTAGTGSEVTKNAVITIPEEHRKVSLRGHSLLPKVAVVDPELTYSLPKPVTASTGMDALTQLIEPFVSISPTPLTDALCLDGIKRVALSLRRAYANGEDVKARQDMSLASLFGGMALANSRLGAVHGLASAIGGWSGAAHGAICARLLPFVMNANVLALRSREPKSEALSRYAIVAQILTGSENADPLDGAVWVNKLCADLEIQPLSKLGLKREDLPGILEDAKNASSMRGNPISLTEIEMNSILELA